MASLFKSNAYRLLCLDVSSMQKDIVKRGKEIQNYLLVEEKPQYDNDLGIYQDSRTTSTIKQAVENLSKPEKRIKESFFWFEFRTNCDEKALKLIREERYEEAVEVWEGELDKASQKSHFYRKNLAIIYSIMLDKTGKKLYLDKSLTYWKDIIEDEKFWLLFYKNYKLFDDLNSRDDILVSFKDEAVMYLADFYLEISSKYQDKSFYERFYKSFKVKGRKVDELVLRDLYKKINLQCENLRKIIAKGNKAIPLVSSGEIEAIISTIKLQLKEIKDLGIYESSEIKVERDKIADLILSLSIYLHNEHSLSEEAYKLALEARSICGTESMHHRVDKNLETIKGIVDFKEFEAQFNVILDHIKKGNTETAIRLIDIELQIEKLPASLKETYLKMKSDIEQRTKLHGKPIQNAPTMYCINGCGTRLYGDTLYFVILFIPIIPLGRYSVKDLGGNQYSFYGKLELHQWQKIWKYAGLVLIGIFLLGLFSNSNSTTTSSSTDSSTITANECSDARCDSKYSGSIYSYFDSSNQKCICKCPSGYTFNQSGTRCITYTDACKEKFGSSSYWTGEIEGNNYMCN